MKLLFLYILTAGIFMNAAANGIHVSYTRHLNKNWDMEPGLRIMINTFSINKNKQNYTYYQTGYAMKFAEHFGLNFRISRKLVAYKSFRLDAMCNLLLTRHSLLQRTTDLPTLDSTGWHLKDDIIYTEPALAGELTLGLKMKLNLGTRIGLVAGTGIGMCLMNYTHNGVSVVSGAKIRRRHMDGPFMNKGRGVFEMVGLGLDGLPMLFVGATYHLAWQKNSSH